MDKKMKPIKWTLETLTNVKRITNKELMDLNLEGRLLITAMNVDSDFGMVKYSKDSKLTNHGFPVENITSIITRIEEKEGRITLVRNIYGPTRLFSPGNDDLVFIIEQDSPEKEYLIPEYAWRPEK